VKARSVELDSAAGLTTSRASLYLYEPES